LIFERGVLLPGVLKLTLLNFLNEFNLEV